MTNPFKDRPTPPQVGSSRPGHLNSSSEIPGFGPESGRGGTVEIPQLREAYGTDAFAEVLRQRQSSERRFQLARDLLVADVHATGLGNGNGDFLDNGPVVAVKLADRLLELLAEAKSVMPEEAVAALSAAFKADPDYAWGWHSNIAMSAYDSGATSEVGNEAARRFMKLAFGVETKEPIHGAKKGAG